MGSGPVYCDRSLISGFPTLSKLHRIIRVTQLEFDIPSKHKPALHQVFTHLRENFKKPACLHPEAPEGCSGGIVSAHSIQLNGGLTKIAENGHVFTPVVSVEPYVSAQLRGINRASTFKGFCKLHDNRLFAPIEDRKLKLNRRSAFLLAYRGISREVHLKRRIETLNYEPRLRNSEYHHSELTLSDSMSRYKHTNSLALTPVSKIHDKMGTAITRKNFRNSFYFAIEFDRVPDILCNGSTFIEVDFHGNRMQRLTQSKPLDLLSVSLLPYGNERGIAIISWYGKSSVNHRFIKSLYSLSPLQIPNAIVRLVFQHFENIYFAPRWWNALSSVVQRSLLERFETSFNPFKMLDIDLRPDGYNYVDWKAVGKPRTNLKL